MDSLAIETGFYLLCLLLFTGSLFYLSFQYQSVKEIIFCLTAMAATVWFSLYWVYPIVIHSAGIENDAILYTYKEGIEGNPEYKYLAKRFYAMNSDDQEEITTRISEINWDNVVLAAMSLT